MHSCRTVTWHNHFLKGCISEVIMFQRGCRQQNQWYIHGEQYIVCHRCSVHCIIWIFTFRAHLCCLLKKGHPQFAFIVFANIWIHHDLHPGTTNIENNTASSQCEAHCCILMALQASMIQQYHSIIVMMCIPRSSYIIYKIGNLIWSGNFAR